MRRLACLATSEGVRGRDGREELSEGCEFDCDLSLALLFRTSLVLLVGEGVRGLLTPSPRAAAAAAARVVGILWL